MSEIIIPIPQMAKETMQLPDPSLLQFYRDYENRVYWLIGEVDDCTYDIMQMILQYNKEDREIEPEKRKPFRIFIASPGGLLDNARSLVALMRMSITPIYTVAVGQVASAASLIYLAGNYRYAISNASFMWHKGGCDNLNGTFDQIAAFTNQYEKEIKDLVDFYKERTKFDGALIESKLRGDWYINLDEAIENGAVDEIIEDIDILL